MQNVIAIDLPAPSAMLIDAVKKYGQKHPADFESKRRLDEFHKHTVNSVSYHFANPDFLTLLVRKEFQHIFPQHRLRGMIGIFRNTQSQPACMPAHTDRTRAVGLNYFVDLGGSNVRTVFYDRVDTVTGTPTNIPYNEVNPVEEYVAAGNTWYAYNVQRCHSVENIETTRIFIALKLIRPEVNSDADFEYTIDDFVKDYPHLVIGS